MLRKLGNQFNKQFYLYRYFYVGLDIKILKNKCLGTLKCNSGKFRPERSLSQWAFRAKFSLSARTSIKNQSKEEFYYVTTYY